MSDSGEPTTTLTVRLPASMAERLDVLAHATGRSRSYLAVEAIRRYLDLETWQIAEILVAVRRADSGELASEQDVAAVREKLRAVGGT